MRISNNHPYSTPPRVLSLFAGIGGIDLGLEAIGCKTVAYSEVDPYACSIMALRFPDALNLGDITTINWSSLDARPDIICGGFPCQDISLAGKGAGIDGERSGLWAHYARAIRELRPRGVLVENVSALLGRGIDRVLRDLAACGYDAEWDCIPAAAVGAPHLRDRIFVIAYRADTQQESSARNAKSGGRNHGVAEDVGQKRSHEHTPRDTDQIQNRLVAATRKPDERRTADNPMRRRYRAPQRQIRSRWDRPIRASRWEVEPAMARVADGLPQQVDRIKCLGNAVVPQVAEHVGRILLDRMEQAT